VLVDPVELGGAIRQERYGRRATREQDNEGKRENPEDHYCTMPCQAAREQAAPRPHGIGWLSLGAPGTEAASAAMAHPVAPQARWTAPPPGNSYNSFFSNTFLSEMPLRTPRLPRRDFLTSTLWTAAGLPLCYAALGPQRAMASDSSAVAITATPLTENIALITGAGANVVAIKGPDGLTLVDGGLEKHSKELVKTALKATGTRRVTTLFNTHWHPEQTGSNQHLGNDGAKIIAHTNTKLWLTRKITVAWRPDTYGPFPAKALPNETFYTTAELKIGDEPVEYGYMAQAHTDGDIYVFLRKANVLIGGGVVSADRWPVLDYQTGGWIGGLVAGLDALIKLTDDKTRIVPADGPILTRADLQAQRANYFTIYDRLVKCLTKGLGPADALATEPAKDINPAWGDSTAFVTMAFKSLWGHFAADA
jgi:cyclase